MIDKFIIGLVGSPFGIKGFVKVRSLSGEIEHLLKLKSVIISKDGEERLVQVREITPAPPFVLMHFNGIDNPEKAKTLNGAKLITGREQAAPLGKGEFYIEDLKGLPVITAEKADGGNSEIIGHITDIIEGGGGELAEIQLINGKKKLVPYRKEFFPLISPENGLKKGKVVLQNLWVLE
jgi:16S rRNA processing protein RimM